MGVLALMEIMIGRPGSRDSAGRQRVRLWMMGMYKALINTMWLVFPITDSYGDRRKRTRWKNIMGRRTHTERLRERRQKRRRVQREVRATRVWKERMRLRHPDTSLYQAQYGTIYKANERWLIQWGLEGMEMLCRARVVKRGRGRGTGEEREADRSREEERGGNEEGGESEMDEDNESIMEDDKELQQGDPYEPTVEEVLTGLSKEYVGSYGSPCCNSLSSSIMLSLSSSISLSPPSSFPPRSSSLLLSASLSSPVPRPLPRFTTLALHSISIPSSPHCISHLSFALYIVPYCA
jgi:hypothetical protein